MLLLHRALGCLVSLLLATRIQAQAGIRAPAVPIGPGNLTGVHIDQPGDGNIWVLAPGYKLRAGRDAVEFHPYLGPKAPRNFPLTLRLRSAHLGAVELPLYHDAEPQVAGTQLSYQRGAVREVWDLRSKDAEQSFVLAGDATGDATAGGDLVLTLTAASELPCTRGPAGLRFVIPGLGEIHYGDVVALDTDHRTVRTEAVWHDGSIELRVPAAFLAQARGPVTVDPLVAALSIDAGNDDNLDPDVAYEPTTDRWLVVYERVFSARDIDIVSRRFSGTGAFLEEVVVASGTRESLNPSVAANAGARQFLVAWDEDRTLDRVILGRTRAAGGTSQGAEFVVCDAPGDTNQAPVVGGSQASDPEGNRYVVVCEQGANDLCQIRVSTASVVLHTQFTFPPSGSARTPSVTKARHTGLPWLMVYELGGGIVAETLPGPSAGFQRVQVNQSGAAAVPVVAGDGNQFLVVHENRAANGSRDLHGAIVTLNGAGLSLGALFNLTALEPGAVLAADQKSPSLSFDGCRFTYGYLEASSGSGNYEPFAATVLRTGSTLTYSDAHRLLVATPTTVPEGSLALAAMGDMGGDAGRNFVVFHRTIAAADHDIVGALYDGVVPGTGVTSAPTGCGGGFEPAISAAQLPALGTHLQIDVAPLSPANTLLFLGPPVPPIPLCAAGCALGVFPFLLTAFGTTSLTVPIPCDPSLIGGRLAVQALVLSVPLGCGTPAFPVNFVLTDTLTLTLG